MLLNSQRASAIVLVAFLVATGCNRDPKVREAAFIDRAKRYMAQKDYSRAAIELNNAVKLQPGDAQAWYQLGLVNLNLNDAVAAVQALRRATQIDRRLTGAQLRLSELEVRSQDPEVLHDAIQRMTQVLVTDANDPDALDTMAIAEIRLNKPEDAIKHLQQALTNFPGHARSAATMAATQFAHRDFEGAEATLKKAQASAPESIEISLALSNLYVFENKKFAADAELQRALKLNPASERALLAMGALLAAEGRIDEADRTYRTVAALPNTRLTYAHAAFLLQQHKNSEAIAEFEKLSTAEPKNEAALLRLVSAELTSGRAADASRRLTAILKRNPKDGDALLMRSRINLASGRALDAENDIEQVLQFKPDSADAHYGMARVDAILGRQFSRRQELEQVTELAPNLIGPRVELAQEQVAAGQADAALRTMDAAPETLKENVSFLAGRNWALLALNRPQEVAAAVDRGLRVERTPDLLTQRGALKSQSKDYDGAIADAEEALALNPAHRGALTLAVEAYIARNQNDAAIAIVRKTADRNAKSPAAQVFAGQWLRKLGRRDEARARFATAKALNPSYSRADIALAALDIAEGKPDTARATLTSLLAGQPQNATAHILLATIDYSAKNRAGALEHFRAAAELEPGNVQALNSVAYLMSVTNPDGALSFADKALELAPEDPQVQDTLGWIYYRKGDFERAVNHLEVAVAKQPTPVHQFHLGMSYVKAGRGTQGYEIVSKALAKDPSLSVSETGW